MKRLILVALVLMAGMASMAQVTTGRHDGTEDYRYNGGGRVMNNSQQHLVIIEVGGKAELYLPSYIRELRPSSVSFRSNEYVDVTSQNRDYCTIRGRKSIKATQVVCRYRWDEIVSGKKQSHEDFYTFNVSVIRIEPEGVNLPQETIVGWGCTSTIRPLLYPENAECGFTYRSSDTSIATVSMSGVVKGVELGDAEITVTTTNGYTASTLVRVVVPECDDVKYKASTKNFDYIGDEMDLYPEISPERSQPELYWESSDPTILSVDQNGHVRALAEGKAAIWLRTNNGKQYYKNYKIKAPKK